MEYIIQVKEEPVDNSYKAEKVATGLNNSKVTVLEFEGQNGVLLKNFEERIENTEETSASIKTEPVVNGVEPVVNGVEPVVNGVKKHDIDDEIDHKSQLHTKKLKTTSSLVKILCSGKKNGILNTSHSSPNQTPTTLSLFNNHNVQSVSSTSSGEDDVQITHTYMAPVLSKTKNSNSSTLQRMLSSPYSAKTPLLSSMLKDRISTTMQSRTNSTIDKVFMASGSQPSKQITKPNLVSAMLRQPAQSSQVLAMAQGDKNSGISNSQNNHGNNLTMRIQDNEVIDVDAISFGNEQKTLPSIPNHGLNIQYHNNSFGMKNEFIEESEKSESLVQNGKIILPSTSKSVHNEEFINTWSNMITEKVVSEFSKNINDTLNSFVKKAIMDGINASPNSLPANISMMNSENLKEDNVLSKLTSSLVNSLKEKITKITFPTNEIQNEIKNDRGTAVASGVNSNCATDVHIKQITSANPNYAALGANTVFVADQHIKQIPNAIPSQVAVDANSVFVPNQHLQQIASVNPNLVAIGRNQSVFANSLNSIVVPVQQISDGSLVTSCANSNVGPNLGINQKSIPNLNKVTSDVNSSVGPDCEIIRTSKTNPCTISEQNKTQVKNTTEKSSKQQDLAPIGLPIPVPVQDEFGEYRYLVFSCKICGKRFQHHGTLSVHQRTHLLESGKSDFICDICGKVCTAQRYLDVHMKTHQRGLPQSTDKLFTCEICSKDFASEEHLTIHKRMHSGEKLYQCEVCQTGFTRKAQLTIHMRIHSGEKPFVCNVCGKSFRQNNGLRLHINIHKEEKPFTCEICGKGFSRKAHYDKHMRKERGERPFTCDLCGKGFTDKFNMNVHKRIHLEDKPHNCTVCGKGFVQIQHLRNHMKFHNGEKGHSCSFCPAKFELKNILQKHVNSVHKYEYEETLSCSRPKRMTKKTPKGKYYDEDDEVQSMDEGQGQATDSGEEDKSENNIGYSDMILHISNEMGEPVGVESMDQSDNLFQFQNNNEEEENGFRSPCHDSFETKIEPVPYDFDSHSLKSELRDKTLLNFDPSIVKEEPDSESDDEMTFADTDHDICAIKCEPLE